MHINLRYSHRPIREITFTGTCIIDLYFFMKVVYYKVISFSLCIYTHVIMIEIFRERGGGFKRREIQLMISKYMDNVHGQNIYITDTAELKKLY